LSCKAKPAPPPAPPAVTVVHPVVQLITDYIESTGSTQAIMTVQLRARVAGYLEKVLFQDGQLVKEGQLLFVVQQNTYRDALAQAEAAILLQTAQLEYATAQFNRYWELFQRKAAAQSDVDNWRFQRDSARANLMSARAGRDLAALNLEYTEVRSPFDGRVDRRLVDPGNLVGSSEVTVLTTVNRIDPIYAYFTISESDLARLTEARWRPGKGRAAKWPVLIGILEEKGYPHKGLLDFASISLTATSGTLQMRGIFANPEGVLPAGAYARVRVPLAQKKGLLVPQEAIGSDQRGYFLLVVGPGDTVVRRYVTVGTEVDGMRDMVKGLGAEEWIVVKGVQKAIPGRRVTPQRQDGPRP
jgi:RND family efflux transporter MFP subunit